MRSAFRSTPCSRAKPRRGRVPAPRVRSRCCRGPRMPTRRMIAQRHVRQRQRLRQAHDAEISTRSGPGGHSGTRACETSRNGPCEL
ncbi:hypothetical protein ACFPRL_34625 [Pseudoclavibacter helvolus]